MGKNIVEKILSFESQYKKMAYIYCLLGHFMMIFQWAIFKYLMNHKFDQNQILYLRGVMVFLFNLYIMKKYNHQVYPENQNAQKTLYFRFIFQMVSPLLQFYGIQQLQISDATVLSLTNPIWIQIFCLIIYGEKLQKKNFIYTLISFVGILFIVRPSFIFGDDLTKNEQADSEKNHLFGCFAMILGSITLAISQSLFKGLQGKTSNVIAMYTPVLMMDKETNDMRIYTDINFMYLLLAITMIAYIAQYFLSRGLMLESPAKLSQLAYTRIIYSFTIDVFYFHSHINFLSIIGVILIVYSSINIVVRKS